MFRWGRRYVVAVQSPLNAFLLALSVTSIFRNVNVATDEYKLQRYG